MRKNIFQLIAESNNLANEVQRIHDMFLTEKTFEAPYEKTLAEYVDKYCFKSWKSRGHCTDIVDYLKAANYNDLRQQACTDEEAFITFIEVVYNIWHLSFVSKSFGVRIGNYQHLKTVMEDCLQRFNQTAFLDSINNRIIIVESKPEVSSVVDIVNNDLAIEIIQYNHRTLKGEIDLKKKILLSMGAELEPERKKLQTIDKQLADDIFFMLNNLNLRHNNRSKKDKNYREYVAKMTKTRLEKWYDELYQMMLVAFLLLDNIPRKEAIKNLKDAVTTNKEKI